MPTSAVPSEHSQSQSPPAANAAAVAVGGPYANYVLGVLFVVYIFNFIDRQILAILLQPIKEDLKISDTALGFLTGFAFAVFYTFSGLPLARLADRWVRRSLIAISIAVWSIMTAASGLARGFTELGLVSVWELVKQVRHRRPTRCFQTIFPRRNERPCWPCMRAGSPSVSG